MNHKNSSGSLSRREFLGRVSLVAGAGPSLAAGRGLVSALNSCGTIGASCARTSPATALVSFHVDQLYLDKTGTAIPYVPPVGARAGQAVSELSEIEFLSRYLYV